MTTRDEYNTAQWTKFVAGDGGAAPPDPLKCSTLDCTGDITDIYPGTTTYNGDAPETKVQCDLCDFVGWRLKLI